MIINTAFSDEYITNVSKMIFEPVTRGESVFCRFFPGHGRSVRLQQIFLEERYIKAGFGDSYSHFVIVRIDASDFAVTRLDHFFLYVKVQLIRELKVKKLATSVNENEYKKQQPLVFTIKDIIGLCGKATQKGLQVVFVVEVGNHPLGNEREFYSAWAKIVEANLDKIHTHIDSETRQPLEKGLLPAVLIQTIINVPLPLRKECDNYIDYYLELWKMKLGKSDREKIYENCGQDSWFIKEALRILRGGKSVSQIPYDPNLLLKAKLQWELYSPKEKETIQVMLARGHVPVNLEANARDLEFVNFWDKKRSIPRIIEQVIIQESSSGELTVDPATQTITLGAIDLSRRFSEVENKILIKLLDNVGNVVKREEVASVIWGKASVDKYSEWAIDKTMSRLRSKLSLYTTAYHIDVKKKKGFVLEE